jgi:hypothetical protein
MLKDEQRIAFPLSSNHSPVRGGRRYPLWLPQKRLQTAAGLGGPEGPGAPGQEQRIAVISGEVQQCVEGREGVHEARRGGGWAPTAGKGNCGFHRIRDSGYNVLKA